MQIPRINPNPKMTFVPPRNIEEKEALINLVEHYLSLPSVCSINQTYKDKLVKKLVLWMEEFAYLPPKVVLKKEIVDMSISLSLSKALLSIQGNKISTQILEDGMKLPWLLPNSPHLTENEKSVASSPRTLLAASILELNGVEYGIERLPVWRKLGDTSVNSLLVLCINKLSDNGMIKESFLSTLNEDLQAKILHWQKVRSIFLKDRDNITQLVLRLGQSRAPLKVKIFYFWVKIFYLLINFKNLLF
jgi:hypothetical protein